jgi:hypothetical protein
MRRSFLCFSLAAILSARAKPETFRWDSWRTQDPKASVEETPLSPEDRAAVKVAIIEILKRGRLAEGVSELQEIVVSARVKLVDVTGDGVPEVIAEGGNVQDFLCSPTGNCPWWVLTKQGDRYVPLLEGFGNGLSTDCRRNKKPCDIAIFMHDSGFELSIALYRLSNGKYQNFAEYDAVWEMDESGRTADKPTVTKVR